MSVPLLPESRTMRLLTVVNVLLFSLCMARPDTCEGQESERCPAFELDDFHGRTFSLSAVNTQATVIAFLGTQCPLAKLYAVRLNDLVQEFDGRVTVWAVNANRQDSMTELAAFAKRHQIRYPLLKDPEAKVADALGAQRTPEVFLLDDQRIMRYQGRIDDQYGVGYARPQPTRDDLRIAIQELLRGEKISVAKTEAVGCIIGRRQQVEPTGDITYAKHIARILQEHCIECHREGQIAPFALTDYDEVVGWAETIREVVQDRRMPPWHADPEHGSFANDRSMPENDRSLLFQWIENGMPLGDVTDLPTPPTYVEGWSLGQVPDQVLPMAQEPFTVPAEGTVEYQYFVVDPKYAEDKWVVAAEVIPGSRAVVHHAIVFVRPPEGERQEGIGWLTAFVPGQTRMSLPPGTARRIPKGSQLVFQLHYTPIGSPVRDLTKVGLVFADEQTIDRELQTRLAINRNFEIPPGDAHYQVDMDGGTFPPDSQLWAIAPHMHYRGKSFSVRVESENDAKTLLHVPNYDFNWQHAYVLSDPLPLHGVTIRCQGDLRQLGAKPSESRSDCDRAMGRPDVGGNGDGLSGDSGSANDK